MADNSLPNWFWIKVGIMIVIKKSNPFEHVHFQNVFHVFQDVVFTFLLEENGLNSKPIETSKKSVS